MPKLSAGVLLYRRAGDGVEVLVAHPGGPIWARRDTGAWSLPKGAPLDTELDLLETARREFEEETGHEPPAGPTIDLGEVRMRSGKVVHAWAIEGDLDPKRLRSMEAEIEWPPRSGQVLLVPEIDRVAWVGPSEARRRLNPAQADVRRPAAPGARPGRLNRRMVGTGGAPAGRRRRQTPMLGEFKAFLTKSNALALAIGVIIGAALGAVVNSLVNDIIMPPIGYLLGGVNFDDLAWVLKPAVIGDPASEVAIRWGAFLQTVITFVIIAFVVFWIARLLIREPAPADPEPSDEAKLLAEIRDELRARKV